MIEPCSGSSKKRRHKGLNAPSRMPALIAKPRIPGAGRQQAGLNYTKLWPHLVKLCTLAVLSILQFLALACAGEPAPLPPQPEPPEQPAYSKLVLIPGPAYSQAIDQFSVGLSSAVELLNSGETELQLDSVQFVCALDQSWQTTRQISVEGLLLPGESRQVEWSAMLNPAEDSGLRSVMENPERNELSWELTVEASATVKNTGTAADGSALLARSGAAGAFPLIREPIITIASMHLLKHDLVNVRLALSLDIHNPNIFPLVFEATEYDFYGEGRRWNKQRHEAALTLPPDAHTRLQLPLTLNFADMNRRLLDLVAGHGIVAYKLVGDANISTGLEYLPRFILHYDRQGSIRVE